MRQEPRGAEAMLMMNFLESIFKENPNTELPFCCDCMTTPKFLNLEIYICSPLECRFAKE